ncbi:unnamed protein product [Periconia digitata]|uniref:Uncharacterized protein n=1 Tax=Periconia digitata TaxID=1303443 RepID=A0A9W4XD33_9PLEO|nr:unnamed protein product [Periconia digitata]
MRLTTLIACGYLTLETHTCRMCCIMRLLIPLLLLIKKAKVPLSIGSYFNSYPSLLSKTCLQTNCEIFSLTPSNTICGTCRRSFFPSPSSLL